VSPLPHTESHGIHLLQHLFRKGERIFTSIDACKGAEEIGIPVRMVNIILSRLTQQGIVRRLRRGLYTSVGMLGELEKIHPFAISAYLVQPSAISHWSALQYHGLTEQIPATVMASTPTRVYTPSMRGKHLKSGLKHAWIIDNVRYEYITVQQKHFELGDEKLGLEKIWIDPYFQTKITDKERTVIDLFVYNKMFGGMSEILGILEDGLASINIEQLVKYALLYDEKSTAKRIGWALEQFGIEKNYLQPLLDIPLASYCLLDPANKTSGTYDSKWMIQNNLSNIKNENIRK
jgi:predicted transcriptional regulator of viral defense system